MSKFADDISARLTIISEMIRTAKPTEKRKLQKERAALEETLRKVTA